MGERTAQEDLNRRAIKSYSRVLRGGEDLGTDPPARTIDSVPPSPEAESHGGAGTSPQVSQTITAGEKRKSGAQERKKRKLNQSGDDQWSGRALEMDPSSDRGNKCFRSVGSTPPDLRQTLKKANNLPKGGAMEGMVVAMAARDYPETLLDGLQVRALDQAVLRVMELNGYVPQFEARRLVEGALRVTYQSERDRLWLQENVGHLRPWDGADLVVKTLDQLPKRTKVRVFVKTTGNAPETIKALGTFNKGLRTGSWRVLEGP